MERPSRRAEGRSAFSLLELVIVLSILATAGAISAARLGSSSQASRLDAGVRRLTSDLTYASRFARSISSATDVAFDTPSSVYRMTSAPDPITGARGYTVDLTKNPYSLRLNLLDENADSRVSFDARGHADSDFVVFVSSTRRTRALKIEGGSSSVRELSIAEIQALQPEIDAAMLEIP